MKRQPDHMDVSDDNGDIESLVRICSRIAAQRAVEVSYQTNGKNSWKTWVLGIVSLLIVAGISAIILQDVSIESEVSAIRANQIQDERRLDNLERRVYREST
jgi:hypothetical protein